MESSTFRKTASDEREAFINYGGAYWLNPVPHGTFRSRSMCTSTKATDSIDPFGNPKRPDRPNLFGMSRYTAYGSGGKGGDDAAAGAMGVAAHVNGGQHGGEKNGGVAGGADGTLSETHGGGRDGDDMSGPLQMSGTDGAGNYARTGEKVPYCAEDVIRDKLPLDTATPERRLMHPGNNISRIPPTGGSAFNGTVTDPWAAPREVDSTYLRLAPLYESTTHYQLRTGLYYTEDEAPPHGMTLPTKNSLPKRECFLMAQAPAGKPSGKFQVLLSRDSLNSFPANASCGNTASSSVSPHCVPPVVAKSAVSSAADPAHANSPSPPRRYGGAIVRVSELQKTGNMLRSSALSFEGPCGSESSAKNNRHPPATMLWSAMGIGSAGGMETGDSSNVSTRRRRMPAKKVKKASSRKSKPSRAAAPRRRTARTKERGTSFQLQPNGEPYEHRWSTVNGRRMLHYNGRTYKGRAAHQLWGKIKSAVTSSKSTASQPPLMVSRVERKKPEERKRTRAETLSTAGIVPISSANTNSLTLNRTTQLSAPPQIVPSSAMRTKLLLDDDDDDDSTDCCNVRKEFNTLPEKNNSASVVPVPIREAKTRRDSESSTISSLTSLSLGDFSSSSSVSSFSSLNSSDIDDTSDEGRSVKNISVKERCVVSSSTSSNKQSPAVVVEHDGWLYPAELLPVLCEQQCVEASTIRQDCSNVLGGGRGLGSNSTTARNINNNNNGGGIIETKGLNLESNQRARGVTVLGMDACKEVSETLPRRGDDADAVRRNSAYSLRMALQNSNRHCLRLLIRCLPHDITETRINDVIREQGGCSEIGCTIEISVIRGFPQCGNRPYVPSTAIIHMQPLQGSSVKEAVTRVVRAVRNIFDGRVVFDDDKDNGDDCTTAMASVVEWSPVSCSFSPVLGRSGKWMKMKKHEAADYNPDTLEEDEHYRLFCAKLQEEKEPCEKPSDDEAEEQEICGEQEPEETMPVSLLVQELAARYRQKRETKTVGRKRRAAKGKLPGKQAAEKGAKRVVRKPLRRSLEDENDDTSAAAVVVRREVESKRQKNSKRRRRRTRGRDTDAPGDVDSPQGGADLNLETKKKKTWDPKKIRLLRREEGNQATQTAEDAEATDQGNEVVTPCRKHENSHQKPNEEIVGGENNTESRKKQAKETRRERHKRKKKLNPLKEGEHQQQQEGEEGAAQKMQGQTEKRKRKPERQNNKHRAQEGKKQSNRYASLETENISVEDKVKRTPLSQTLHVDPFKEESFNESSNSTKLTTEAFSSVPTGGKKGYRRERKKKQQPRVLRILVKSDEALAPSSKST